MRTALASAVLLLMTAPTVAAGIAFDARHKAIYIVGEIHREDADRFNQLFMARPETEAVYITSPGGSFWAGLDIAATVSGNGLATYSGSKCESACGSIWLAGVKRFASDDVRMHAPSRDGALSTDLITDIEFQLSQWPEIVNGIAKVFTTGDNALFSILDGYGVAYETFDRTDWMDFSIALRDGRL